MFNDRKCDLNRCRVLVVEDEYLLAYDLEKALRDHGADVVGPIANLSEALSQVRRDGFDVAAIDINLHGQRGARIRACIGS